MLSALRGCILPRHRVGLAGCLALAIWAADAHAIFIVNQPWVRPAAAGGSSEAYMDLTSTEGATLIGARSEIATVTIRSAATAPVARLPLPAKTMVRLAPEGYRLALSKLGKAVRRGERVILTLTVEAADGSRQDIPVNAEAQLRSPLEDERRAHGAH